MALKSTKDLIFLVGMAQIAKWVYVFWIKGILLPTKDMAFLLKLLKHANGSRNPRQEKEEKRKEMGLSISVQKKSSQQPNRKFSFKITTWVIKTRQPPFQKTETDRETDREYTLTQVSE